MSDTRDFKYDVFLSHNEKDKLRVRELAQRLKDAGLRVWLDDWVIKAGDDIYLAVERGLEASRVQVLCLSPTALSSDWVILERSTVLFRDPTNSGRRFIPILLADCKLPDSLRRYKHVDFRKPRAGAFEELLAACWPETESGPAAPREPAKKPVPSNQQKAFQKLRKQTARPVHRGREEFPRKSLRTGGLAFPARMIRR